MSREQTHNANSLIREAQQLLKRKEFHHQLYDSANGVSRIFISILDPDSSIHWTERVVDSDGKPIFTSEEKSKFKHAFQPYERLIREFFLPTRQQRGQQRGGAEEPSSNDKEVADMMNITPDELKDLRESSGVESDGTSASSEEMKGVDDFYMTFMRKIDEINSTMNQFASNYGISRLEQSYDLDKDFQVIPNPVISLISMGITKIPAFATSGPDIKEALESVRIPFRLIVTAIYLFLDVTRIAMTLQGVESQRKTLTILITLVELLRGDWKKAILSFLGYFGTTPLLFGQFGKIYISMFRLLAPSIQESITYGVLDTTKSFLIGFLLAIFKIAAPEKARLSIISVFDTIAKKKEAIDGVLEGQGLPPRPAYLSPSFHDFNNLQSMTRDPEFVCSCEYKDILDKVKNSSSIVYFIMQLLGLPVSNDYRDAYQCPGPCVSFNEALVKKGIVIAKREGRPLPPELEEAKEEQKEEPKEEKKEEELKEEEPKEEEQKEEKSTEEKKEEEPKEEQPKEEKPKEEKPKEESKMVPPTIQTGGFLQKQRRLRAFQKH